MSNILDQYEENPFSRNENLLTSSKKSKYCVNYPCSDYMRNINFIINILSFGSLFISMVVVMSITADTLTLISDSKETISDLQVIIPEIKNTLSILQTLCSHEEFKNFCYNE
mgnify:CR=1 FL=1|tara:strand:+ start:41 stop:376 length:336 start_codon:yes stop_codon:yes gene_type:complete